MSFKQTSVIWVTLCYKVWLPVQALHMKVWWCSFNSLLNKHVFKYYLSQALFLGQDRTGQGRAGIITPNSILIQISCRSIVLSLVGPRHQDTFNQDDELKWHLSSPTVAKMAASHVAAQRRWCHMSSILSNTSKDGCHHVIASHVAAQIWWQYMSCLCSKKKSCHMKSQLDCS